MLVPSNTGKLPRTELSGANEAGIGAHTAVNGVQLLAKPLRPPKAAGCTPFNATSEEAPVAKRYDARNWYRGSVGGRNKALAFAPKNAACSTRIHRMLRAGMLPSTFQVLRSSVVSRSASSAAPNSVTSSPTTSRGLAAVTLSSSAGM